MSKRSASQTRGPEDAPMKQGERPERPEEDEAGPFEDDQEDEFEDEIIEIGEDGQIAMAGAEDDSDDDAGMSMEGHLLRRITYLTTAPP